MGRMPRDPEMLKSMGDIIDFTGIPRATFYAAGHADHLKNSGYIFQRPGKYGLTITWSYKRLILAWLTERFPNKPKIRRS